MEDHRCADGPDGSPPVPVAHSIPDSLSCRDASGEWSTAESARSLTRRGMLAGAGASLGASFAGCAALSGGSTPAAVAMGEQATCDVCGMVIAKHPGPNGQIFYEDHDPESHDPPFRFDSLKACAFDHYFSSQRQNWSIEAFYVTDYSIVDYTVAKKGENAEISSHETPASFENAKSVSYVVDADVYGAMGKDFVPFSDEDDARDFADEYGGEVVSFGDISAATLK